ncbi:MAG TPA: hypothetical protein VFI49_14535 [Rudaea sp.]|nr:hypothetical protein [Rudaea sp.]
MIRFIVLALLAACCVGSAFADQLQFTVGIGGAFAAYSEVHVTDKGNREVFRGFTDRLGRVSIAMPAGTYQVTLKTRQNQVFHSPVQINGASNVRTIALQ